MTNLKELHAFDDGEIYTEIKGVESYLAVRFLDDFNVDKVSVFKWIGAELTPSKEDSLINSRDDWDFFTTFDLSYTGEEDEEEIDWEAYESDLDKAIEEAKPSFTAGLGSRIKEVREYWHMNQSELAEKVGVDQRQISRYENGLHEPSARMILKLAEALRCTVNFILGDMPRVSTTWKPEIVIPITDETPRTAEEAKRLMEEVTGDEYDLEDIEESVKGGWLTWEDGALVNWVDGEAGKRGLREYQMFVK